MGICGARCMRCPSLRECWGASTRDHEHVHVAPSCPWRRGVHVQLQRGVGARAGHACTNRLCPFLLCHFNKNFSAHTSPGLALRLMLEPTIRGCPRGPAASRLRTLMHDAYVNLNNGKIKGLSELAHAHESESKIANTLSLAGYR